MGDLSSAQKQHQVRPDHMKAIPEALLAGSVPDLQLDGHAIQFDGANLEVDANSAGGFSTRGEASERGEGLAAQLRGRHRQVLQRDQTTPHAIAGAQ